MIERQSKPSAKMKPLTASSIEADNARLRDALEPFAAASNDIDDTMRDSSDIWEHPAAICITAGDMRRARAALARLARRTI